MISRRQLGLVLTAAVLVAVLAAVLVVTKRPASTPNISQDSTGRGGGDTAPACDKYASPSGSDSNAGTEAAPFRSIQQLADSLNPGDTGCLRAGTYEEPDQQIDIEQGGTSSSLRITIMSAPNERAKIKGRLWIAQPYVTVRDLDLDGSNTLEPDSDQEGLPSPTVNGSDAWFINDDVTNNAGQTCFLLGDPDYGTPSRTLIQDSRIHDCGKGNNEQHGISISYAYDTWVLDNYIYDNAGRGVQLYPNAQRTRIKNNVLDGNGENISIGGNGTYASSNNTITNNVVANAIVRSNVEYYWPDHDLIGRGNLVQLNCMGSAALNTKTPNGGILQPETGFSAHGNVVVSDPLYVDRAGKDFHLKTDSPCWAVYSE